MEVRSRAEAVEMDRVRMAAVMGGQAGATEVAMVLEERE